MNIIDWENNLSKNLKYEKINTIDGLKDFVTNPENYSYNFSISEITEDSIADEDFYAAYILDEKEILKKDVISYSNSGWVTTIVVIGSSDKKKIDDYYILGLNGFTQEEVRQFLDNYFQYDDKQKCSD